jgi:branched-chain amino acid aminotransferase
MSFFFLFVVFSSRLADCWRQYFICPVSLIHHRGTDVAIPMGAAGEGTGGAVTERIKRWVGDIMYGREPHPWGVVVGGQQS